MIRRKLIQHVSRRRVAGLCLLRMRHPQLFKQDHAQLLGGIDIEFLAREIIDFFFQLHDPRSQLIPVCFQGLGLYLHACLFHMI